VNPAINKAYGIMQRFCYRNYAADFVTGIMQRIMLQEIRKQIMLQD